MPWLISWYIVRYIGYRWFEFSKVWKEADLIGESPENEKERLEKENKERKHLEKRRQMEEM